MDRLKSHGCKGKEPFTLMPNTPHFFKIIFQNNLDEQKLMIPVKFVRNHGEHLLNQATIKVPDGSTWKVDLKKSDGEVWLKKGWKAFSDYYSLVHGHFLLFEYRGNSEFYVLILDNTATEIDYPLSSVREADHEVPQHPVEDSDSEDDASVQILEGFSYSRKKTERPPPLPIPNPRKIINTDPTSKASVIEKAKAFKSQHPFFSVVIQPSYVKVHGYLNVPCEFSKKHFKENSGEAILRVSNGRRTWTVNYAVDKQSTRFCSSSTLAAFTKDNNLKVGDVCVFELINDIELSFQVFIYRLNEGANCRPSISQLEPGKKPAGKFLKGSSSSGVPEAAATKTYPFFKVLLKPSCFDACGVYVPKSFAEKYVKHEKPEMQLQVGDRSWPVKLNCPANGIVTLSAGWSAFSKGNSLKVGDVCTFELIKGNVLRVSIIRS